MGNVMINRSLIFGVYMCNTKTVKSKFKKCEARVRIDHSVHDEITTNVSRRYIYLSIYSTHNSRILKQ